LEPARTNILNFSESFNNAYFELGAAASISANTNETTDPSGYYGADKLTANGSGSIFVRRNVFGGTAQPCSVSLFVKKANHRYVGFRNSGTTSQHDVFDFDTKTWTNNSGATLSYEEHANGWFRLKSTNTDAVNLNYYWSVIPALNTSGEENQTVSNLSVYIWGGQAEQNASYVSSYVPTLGTAVTRVAETALKTSVSSLIGASAGVVYFEGTIEGEGASTRRVISISDGTNANYLLVYNPAGTRGLDFVTAIGGVVQCNITSSSSIFQHGQRFKMAFAYAQNDFAFYINGTQIGIDGNGNIPSGLDRIIFGRGDQNSSVFFEGNVSQTLLFKTRLTNAQLAELTTL
jgi:hypothetical protein